jgi:dihydroorotate dehydrogenase (NAD+) catalytic subunit
LAVEVAGIRMKNPVMTASGTFGYAREFEPYMDLNRLGALVVKTITRLPRAGNPPPRVVETPAGMLNAIGLQNVGIEAFIREKLPYLRRLEPPLIVNVAGESVEDFRDLTKRIGDQEGVAGIELNVSCPNVAGGLDFSTDPDLAYRVVKAAREATRLPIIPKLSPNVTDIAAIAAAVADAGADAISLINTLVGMAVDVRTRQPKIGNVTGGLSGPAIRPVAVRMVWQVAAHRRHGWNRDGGGCSGVSHRGGHGRGGRDGQLRRSDSRPEGHRGSGAILRGQRDPGHPPAHRDTSDPPRR